MGKSFGLYLRGFLFFSGMFLSGCSPGQAVFSQQVTADQLLQPTPGPTATSPGTSTPTEPSSPGPSPTLSSSPTPTSSPTPNPTPTPTPTKTVCDAFSHPSPSSSPSPLPSGAPSSVPGSGVVGSLVYLDSSNVSYSRDSSSVSSFSSLVNSPSAVRDNTTFIFKGFFVPTQNFSTGFKLSNGENLLNPKDGSVIDEYFGFTLNTYLTLSSSVSSTSVRYRFAAISDDGSNLYVDGISIEPDTNGNHATMMLCDNYGRTTQLLTDFTEVTKTSARKFKVEWYQGPRVELALVIVYHPILSQSDIDSTNSDCSNFRGVSFFDSSAQSQPKSTWTSLLSKGWKVLSNDSIYSSDIKLDQIDPTAVPSSGPSTTPSSTPVLCP